MKNIQIHEKNNAYCIATCFRTPNIASHVKTHTGRMMSWKQISEELQEGFKVTRVRDSRHPPESVDSAHG